MRADASQPVGDGVNANQDAPNTPYEAAPMVTCVQPRP
jgi:hypothetical protein